MTTTQKVGAKQGRGARQTHLFSFRVLRKLLSGVRAGLTPEAAAHKAAIPGRQLKAALSKAVEDLDNDPDTPEARLLLAIRQQEAACQLRWVGLLESAGYSRARVHANYVKQPTGALETHKATERMDAKAFMYLLERRYPKDWGPVATATDMHTAAAVDLLRQGVTELKRAREAELPAGPPPLAREGVDAGVRVPLSFVDETGTVGNGLPLALRPRLPAAGYTKDSVRKDADDQQ